MKPVIALIAQGAMGAGTGARLAGNGLKVLTSLAGRSPASAKRAADAGMQAVADAELAQADIFLSIVPPGEALPLAQRLAPVLHAAKGRMLYVDCNAINPQTVTRAADVVAQSGCAFADAGIIGGPPRQGYGGPHFYVSGEQAARVAVLAEYGLSVRVMDGQVGAASALKMSYGGITKGLTAIGSAMVLAAQRNGVGEALHRELSESQPALMTYFSRSVPDMFGKAYRWVAEMEEIAGYAGRDAEQKMYDGIASLYQCLADDNEGEATDIAALRDFFKKESS